MQLLWTHQKRMGACESTCLYIDKVFCVGELHEQRSTTKHFQYIEILFQSRIVPPPPPPEKPSYMN